MQKTVFPANKRAFLFNFQCLPLFLLSLLLASPFFTFSFSVSLLLFAFFLPSLSFFFLSFGSLFWSLSLSLSVSFFFAFVSKIFNYKVAFHQSFFFWGGFLSCFLFQIPFSYLCFCLILGCVLSNINVFLVSKKDKLKHTCLVKRGVATKRFFFMNLCFAKCEKLSFFWGPFFWQILVDIQKTL